MDDALLKLDEVGGYGYVATWRKNLFAFNTKLLSKRCGLIDENGSLLKAYRLRALMWPLEKIPSISKILTFAIFMTTENNIGNSFNIFLYLNI